MKRKRTRKIKVLNVILAVLFVIIAIGGIYFVNIYSKLNHKELKKEDLGITSQAMTDDKNDTSITNIALFGVDKRDNETKFRSDSIIVLSVDKQHNKIKLSSIMRDSLVKIEGHDQYKINQAYYYGGPQLAVKTLNQNFGLNIQEYATVNFQQMAQIIEAVGGVEVDVSEIERVETNKYIWEQSLVANLNVVNIEKPGLQTLNGTQAVAYARIRHVGNGDFERTDRQREVLHQIFNKALKMNKLQYPEFARKLLPTIETSLSFGEIVDLGSIMLRDVTFEEARFPRNEDLIGNGVIWVNSSTQCLNLDVKATGERIKDFIYNDINPEKVVIKKTESQTSSKTTNRTTNKTSSRTTNK
ncbi:LCP family protein [Paludicola sp. MB14-C6]|uniref:LCP family protein n=1 Tax=Paludihabitans sp. MB14-C6 TaxID=3070656 RepID=UPI0027DD55CB|nr:LCP family protein [Paludicola sp. MB14-C6]WMJ22475.1 LCP family protein [Paludicola sp. MB14-C6]